MKRRLSVLAFMVVLALASTPHAASNRYAVEGCRQISECEVECCNSRGICLVFILTGCY